MNVVTGIETFRPRGGPVNLGLGTFDGLHKGHRAILDVLQTTSPPGGETVVTTFDPHPLTVIAPPQGPFLLSTLEERIELFRGAGVDTLIVVRFDHTLRTRPARAWLEQVERYLRPARIVVSSTHAFGHNREGTVAMLESWASAHGIAVTVVPPVTDGGVPISSTAIRQRLREGDVRGAAMWLGRWYSVRGKVVPGAGRGSQIGVPTANLSVPPEKLLPANGVYAAYATAGQDTHPAAVNIGIRPTFGGGAASVEAHLIDAKVDLYGDTLDVGLVERLRSEQRFSDVAALVDQIASDIRAARRILQQRQPETV
jgi:riboflavin kinase/FMN adenylyltransferase